MRAKKGSSFEREMSKRLSLWWTKNLKGGPRDDIFWRCSQSGGRATQRMKSGRRTFGSYGDVAAVDPIGQPLLEFFTIELKRGSSHGIPGDLLDFKEANSKHAWVKCLMQAIKSHEQAQSVSWLLIVRRDHRRAMVYLETGVFKRLWPEVPLPGHMARFTLLLPPRRIVFSALLLEDFLRHVRPITIKTLLPSPSGAPGSDL